jgi:hypothetical protein
VQIPQLVTALLFAPELPMAASVAVNYKIHKEIVRGRKYDYISWQQPQSANPMNKIEFSDVNRFLASLGLISIGLAFFLPWFVNQNNSLLIIEEEKILKLTLVAQQIISKQQSSLLTINKLLPFVSGGLIILGFCLLFMGIIRWSKRQAVIDKIQDEDLKAKEFQNLTSKEKRDLIETEIENTEDEPNAVVNQEARTLEIDAYIQIENSIFLQFTQSYKTNYIASQNVRIGNFEYDIILKSKDLTLYKDKIIEIKFFKNRITYETIKDAATKLILACNYYEENFKRRTSPILIIIYSENEFDETIKQYKRNLELYGTELGKPLKVNLFDRQKVVSTKAADFLK